MMIIYTVERFNIHADVDAIYMTPSRNTRSYTLRSVPSSPGRSFFHSDHYLVRFINVISVIKYCMRIAAKKSESHVRKKIIACRSKLSSDTF